MKRTLVALALALGLSAPAWGMTYYLVPQPFTKICEQGEYLTIYRVLPQTENGHGGYIEFRCWFGKHFKHSYVSMEVSSEDAGTIFVQPRGGDWLGSGGWFRVTYNIVPGTSVVEDGPGRQY